MGKKAFIDTTIHIKMNEAELMSDERVVYMYLITCPYRTLHGLYEINMMDVAYNCGLSKDRIPVIFRVLSDRKFIQYSNRLLFVEEIPNSENFINRLYNEKMPLNKKSIHHTINKYCNYRGEIQQNNIAYEAFCEYYKNEIPFIMDKTFAPLEKDGYLFSNPLTTPVQPLDNPLTTLVQPLDNPLTTLVQQLDEKSPTLVQPLDNPLTTVGRKTPNPCTTLVQPLDEKPPTPVQPLYNSLSTA